MLELVSTVPHDGSGGVADELDTVESANAWVRTHVTPEARVDEGLRKRLVALRRAVRSLFARAVRPAPPNPADADRLLTSDGALARLNADAALVAVRPRLTWGAGDPGADLVADGADPADAVVATLARAAVAFLAGPDRKRLRSCTAPRCVRYFVQAHGRQQWCKASCGNRARAARHYARHGAPQN